MKTIEWFRIIAFSLIGLVIMLWGQPLLYRSQFGIFATKKIGSIEGWIVNFYIPGAMLVFGVCVASTLLWYFLAARAQPRTAGDRHQWQLVWMAILFLPVLSIGLALYLYNYKNEAVLSRATLFILDAAFLYWFITATSSPKELMYAPPGAFTLRRLPLFRD
ncbi:hypothetical protein [Calothrix sp. UHCC 0171]|uniref:hypothetical protein n=1 Tax=Calothrix sp. UHCC 0171 TaxID=3110245 RepID=UPI002B219375|nr:hypothetical protein [Calothrix sp. UHCC 0171]MEA5572383.1 hypothetical protein [Calothrix sp. UHCC 0171]